MSDFPPVCGCGFPVGKFYMAIKYEREINKLEYSDIFKKYQISNDCGNCKNILMNTLEINQGVIIDLYKN